MTNKQLVEEINKAIRGVASNYPIGLADIRRQLDLVDPQPVVYAAPEAPKTVTLADPPAQWVPKRGPGRPKGSRNKASKAGTGAE